jgi:hypothetical protein
MAMLRASVNPTPRLAEPGKVSSPCTNKSKTFASISGRMPIPLF